ncbi:MAG: sulfatase-like hydrolase/transferase, partial [Verrucomicrobiota bacterium]
MNFIIFMPDELRAESVCCYGHPLRHTPHFDSFAAEGTRFSQCHVQHTVCTPSRCSMMTGWYPHVRGHRTLWNLLQPDEPNLFKYLKSVGYDVRCWGKNDLFSEEAFKSSVHEFAKPQIPESCQDRTRMSKKDQVFANDTFLYPAYSGGEASAGDYHAVQEAIRYLQSGPEEHFLLFLP